MQGLPYFKLVVATLLLTAITSVIMLIPDWNGTQGSTAADDIDRELFEQTMSIIVKHRADLDMVSERVGVKLSAPGKLDVGAAGSS